jgi:tetratricopeptide (TPR) repeat protein
MGEALLNLALNVSNNGRFAEADRLFRDADIQVEAANDPLWPPRRAPTSALHLRNAGRFAEAVTAGQSALRASDQARAARGLGASGPMVAQGRQRRRRHRRRPVGSAQHPPGRPRRAGRQQGLAADRLVVQDAQALEVVGSSLGAQGDRAGAREALNRAARLLTAAEVNGALNVWLRARIEADLAQIDLDSGQAAAAAARYAEAVKVIRLRHAGTAAEGGLLLDLGRAQIAAKQEDAALATYQRAFDLFQQQRGALGASADDAAPYFDLLLARMASDPGKADDYRGRFFSAAESVVSNATAQTVSKLAARVASGDSAVTGLVRALDDTRRELRATEAQAAQLQGQNAYVGQDRTDIETRLKTPADPVRHAGEPAAGRQPALLAAGVLRGRDRRPAEGAAQGRGLCEGPAARLARLRDHDLADRRQGLRHRHEPQPGGHRGERPARGRSNPRTPCRRSISPGRTPCTRSCSGRSRATSPEPGT